MRVSLVRPLLAGVSVMIALSSAGVCDDCNVDLRGAVSSVCGG